MKHTTGEWLIDAAGNGQITIVDDSILNRHICYMPLDAMPEGEQEANSVLIANCPAILEALELAADRLELCAKRLGGTYEKETAMYVFEARTAAAKARGTA